MTWLSVIDLENRFGLQVITDLQSGGASADLAVSDAMAEAEGYVSRVITLPVTTPGAALVRIGADIARYNLWRRDVPADHPVAVAYRAAIAQLHSVAIGGSSLAGLVGTESTSGGSSGFVVSSSRAVFTDARLDLMTSPYDTPGSPWL